MSTKFIAGTSATGAVMDSGNDGILDLVVGPAGLQVTALRFEADGTPTFLKPPTVTATGSGLGYKQHWAVLSLALGATYTNPAEASGGKPIQITVQGNTNNAAGGYVYATITDGTSSPINVPMCSFYSGGGGYPIVGSVVVPAGSTVSINMSVTSGSPSITGMWILS
jgi:hypothetical protein